MRRGIEEQRARRLHRLGQSQSPSEFPPGLTGFGRRWQDREFELATAEEELVGLVADVPGLRESALAMVGLWQTRGHITPEDQRRLIRRLGGDPSDVAVPLSADGDAPEPEDKEVGLGTAPLEELDGSSEPPVGFPAEEVGEIAQGAPERVPHEVPDEPAASVTTAPVQREAPEPAAPQAVSEDRAEPASVAAFGTAIAAESARAETVSVRPPGRTAEFSEAARRRYETASAGMQRLGRRFPVRLALAMLALAVVLYFFLRDGSEPEVAERSDARVAADAADDVTTAPVLPRDEAPPAVEPVPSDTAGAVDVPAAALAPNSSVPPGSAEADAPAAAEAEVADASAPVGTGLSPEAGPVPDESAPTAPAVERPPPGVDGVLRISPTADEVPVVRLRAVENGDSVTVALRRSTGLDQQLDLEVMPISREDGLTSAGNMAFSLVQPVVTLAPGQERYTLEIGLPDDDVVTGTRRYGYFVAQAVPEIRLLGRIELEVQDDELLDKAEYLPAGTVSFAYATDSVSESASEVRIRLVRYGQYGSAFAANVRITGVAASEGEDYAGPSEQVIRFAPGNDSETFSIPLLDDDVAEPEEGLWVSLDHPEDELSAPAKLYIRIIDDDS